MPNLSHNWDMSIALQLAAVGPTSEGEQDRAVDNKMPAAAVAYWSEEYAVRKHWVKIILRMMGISEDSNLRDCFANASNKRFQKYFTAEQNALVQPWDQSEVMWCNPPWSIWPATAQKIINSQCVTVAVFPSWESKDWVKQLTFMASKVIYFEIGSRIFELWGKPVGGIKWGLYAVLIQPVHGQPVSVGSISWSPAARRRWRRKQQKQHAE